MSNVEVEVGGGGVALVSWIPLWDGEMRADDSALAFTKALEKPISPTHERLSVMRNSRIMGTLVYGVSLPREGGWLAHGATIRAAGADYQIQIILSYPPQGVLRLDEPGKTNTLLYTQNSHRTNQNERKQQSRSQSVRGSKVGI